MTRYLVIEDLLYMASRLGLPPPRDLGLIESALARTRTSVFGADAYPDIHTKTAALVHSLVRNHGFVEGNERIGWLSAGAFYWLNDLELDASEDPAYDLVIDVATGRRDVPEIAATLSAWVRPRT